MSRDITFDQSSFNAEWENNGFGAAPPPDKTLHMQNLGNQKDLEEEFEQEALEEQVRDQQDEAIHQPEMSSGASDWHHPRAFIPGEGQWNSYFAGQVVFSPVGMVFLLFFVFAFIQVGFVAIAFFIPFVHLAFFLALRWYDRKHNRYSIPPHYFWHIIDDLRLIRSPRDAREFWSFYILSTLEVMRERNTHRRV